jgi:teichuronic acid biosynthesis glycosyltransferase TuaG
MSEAVSSGVKRTVSVVVPLYNTEKYVAECIRSALDQTLQDLEVLVIDDGSRDRSVKIVEEIARRDSRVRLLQHPGGINLGVSRTRRLGIMEASGEYIAYLDADDAFEPSKLERQVSLMKAHPACLLCHTGIKAVVVPLEDHKLSRLLESQGKPSIEAQAKQYSGTWNGFRPGIAEYSYLDRPHVLTSNVICNSSVLAVAEAVRSTPAASQQLFQSEDFAQWILLATKGPFLYTPEPLTCYRVHADASSYLVEINYLRHLYKMIEFLTTIHAFTHDLGLRASAESELIYHLGLIRDVYTEETRRDAANSSHKSQQPPGNFDQSSWGHTTLQLQSQVNDLQAQVRTLAERLAKISGSRVYQSLVKIRNLLRSVVNVGGL